jgi:uncharacterized membrane protein (UPF0127 family)
VSKTMNALGGLLASLALASLAQAAPPAPKEIPRVANTAKCDKAQPEIQPLQPLSIVTPKGKTDFMVEYAGNDNQREHGLMCRKSLAPSRGMLFDFKAPMKGIAFWMRNTLIPLDLIYIKPDGGVLSIARNARPMDETGLPANGVARWVLEIPGGRAAQLGVLPGDKVLHKTMPTK